MARTDRILHQHRIFGASCCPLKASTTFSGITRPTADELNIVVSAGDVIYTNMPTQGPDAPIPNVQYFWEAFPSGSGSTDRTTYLFTYIDADPSRHASQIMVIKNCLQWPVLACKCRPEQPAAIPAFSLYASAPRSDCTVFRWSQIVHP